jgi:predicted DNA binding CopG/RHH family protein
MKNKIPKFKSEADERAFWASHDSVGYVDWKKGRKVIFSNLRPSLKSISLRLPGSMIEELRLLANKRDVPYQSLLKMFLSERIAKELRA